MHQHDDSRGRLRFRCQVVDIGKWQRRLGHLLKISDTEHEADNIGDHHDAVEYNGRDHSLRHASTRLFGLVDFSGRGVSLWTSSAIEWMGLKLLMCSTESYMDRGPVVDKSPRLKQTAGFVQPLTPVVRVVKTNFALVRSPRVVIMVIHATQNRTWQTPPRVSKTFSIFLKYRLPTIATVRSAHISNVTCQALGSYVASLNMINPWMVLAITTRVPGMVKIQAATVIQPARF